MDVIPPKIGECLNGWKCILDATANGPFNLNCINSGNKVSCYDEHNIERYVTVVDSTCPRNVVFPKNFNFGELPPPSYLDRFQNFIGDNKGLITFVGGAATVACFYNAYRNIRVLSNPSLSTFSSADAKRKHIVKTILWVTGGVFSVGLSIYVNK
jgi:hypothetical protein